MRQIANWPAFLLVVLVSISAARAQTIPPPPVIQGDDQVSYSTYPLVLMGGRRGQQLPTDVAQVDSHYLFGRASRGAVVFLNQRADCSPTSTQVRILTPPANGELRAEHYAYEPARAIADGLPSIYPGDVSIWGKNDPRGHCRAHSLQALWLHYVPAVGFSGIDSSSVEIEDGGRIWRIRLWLQVKR